MMNAWDFLGPVILPVDATYTVLQDRCDSLFCPSSYTTTVVEVPPDVVGTIAIDGPPVTFTLGTPGQQAHLTFAGVAGQHVGILAPQGTIECWFLGLADRAERSGGHRTSRTVFQGWRFLGSRSP